MPTYTLMQNSPSGTRLRWLRFDREPHDYTEPGQFVAVDLPDAAQAFFAIASSPGTPLELLVKEEGDVAEHLAALQPGAHVDASDALGSGFRAAATRPRPLVCLVNGSALSAVRPVIQDEIDAGLPRAVHLFYGVLSPEHRAFAQDLRRWEAEGVQVVEVMDRRGTDWAGPVGFIQDHVRDLGLVRDDVAVLLCGVPPMQDAARALYASAGLDPAYLLTNY